MQFGGAGSSMDSNLAGYSHEACSQSEAELLQPPRLAQSPGSRHSGCKICPTACLNTGLLVAMSCGVIAGLNDNICHVHNA